MFPILPMYSGIFSANLSTLMQPSLLKNLGKKPILQNSGNCGRKSRRNAHILSLYIDTNVFDYSALAHPVYGKACKQIIDDIQNKKIEAYCSFLVPIELLGSLARIDAEKAAIAVTAFFSLPINMIQIDEGILQDAAIIMLDSGVSYDSVHAACMRRTG